MQRPGDWAPLEREGPEMVLRDGVALRAGSRVRVHPAAGGDIFDLALAGRVAIVERIEQDAEGSVHVAAGDYATCAADGAGALHCWGRVLDENVLGPRRVDIADVRRAAISGFGVCALKSDRSLHCWGDPFVGDGTQERRARPVHILDDVAQVTQGVDHTCALGVPPGVRCGVVVNARCAAR